MLLRKCLKIEDGNLHNFVTNTHTHTYMHTHTHTLSFYSICRVVTFRGQIEETGNTFKILMGNRLKMATWKTKKLR